MVCIALLSSCWFDCIVCLFRVVVIWFGEVSGVLGCLKDCCGLLLF